MFLLNACVAQGFFIFAHFLPAMGIETDFMGFWRCRNKRTMDLTDKETSVQWPDMQCLFLQEWWWDAVCPPAERLVLGLDEAASAGTAFWPLAKVKRYGGMFSVLSMPPLTQHSGPWLADRADFSTLLSHLPRTANIKMNLSFALSEKAIQQAQQAGIRVSEGATYVIRDCRDLEKVFASIKPAQQRQIRKGMRNLHLLPEADAEMLISLQQETFARQGRKSPYPEKVVRRLCETVQRHEAGRLVALADAEGSSSEGGTPVFSGRILARVSTLEDPLPLSAQTEQVDWQPMPLHVDVRTAPLVVSGGMGVDPSLWPLLEQLARDGGGATACTRPVYQAGRRPYFEHVGQTGAKVAPALYLAVGISGALQHIAGMIRSRKVLAINTDPQAEIFKYADYGVVGDAGRILPGLVEELRRRSGSLANASANNK